MTTSRQIEPAPDKLVDNGNIRHGVFDAPPRDTNLHEAGLLPGLIKNLRYKKWQFFMIAHPRFALGFVILDIGYLTSSFLYVLDRRDNTLRDHKRISPSGGGSVAESLWSGKCEFRTRGYSIEIQNNLDQGRHSAVIDIAKSGKAPAVTADISIRQSPGGTRPLVVSLPVGDKRAMYSHKVVCTASGTVRIGDESFTLDPTRDTAIMDEHKAYYPYHTYWKWMCFGFIEGGRAIGANLTDNLIKDQTAWNENAVLTPDGVNLLGPASFNFDLKNITKPWHIRDTAGLVELEFTPLAVKYDNTNALILRTDYRQPIGLFNGTITDHTGRQIKVREALGVTEYFDANY